MQSQVGNAGVKVVLTKRALDYAAEHAVEVLAKEIPQTQLDNFAGSTKLLIGRVEYEINDARVGARLHNYYQKFLSINNIFQLDF